MFWRLSTNLCSVLFSTAARVEPVCRRLSSHVCVHFGLPPAKRKDRDYVLASFNKFILCMILTGCAGGTALPMLSSDVCVDFGSPPSKTGGW